MKKYILFILLLTPLLYSSFIDKAEKKCPNFKLLSLNGDTLSNEDLQGKITVINIWATWCKPCVEEIPELNKVVSKYKDDRGVLFIALTDDDPEKTKKLLEQTPFNYQQILNAKTLMDGLQTGFIRSRPTHFIINEKGVIVDKKIGASPDIADYLITEIEKEKKN